jgi:hypothetical protein
MSALVFQCWKSKPKFHVREDSSDRENKEISLVMKYKRKRASEALLVIEGHEALDLANSFIAGCLYERRKQERKKKMS